MLGHRSMTRIGYLVRQCSLFASSYQVKPFSCRHLSSEQEGGLHRATSHPSPSPFLTHAPQATDSRTNNYTIDSDLVEYLLDPEIYYQALAPDPYDPYDQQIRDKIDFVLAQYEALKAKVTWVPTSLNVQDMEVMVKIVQGKEADTLPVYLSAVFKREVGKLRAKQLRHQKAESTHEQKQEFQKWLQGNTETEFSLYDKDGCPIYKLWRNNMLFKINTSSSRRKASSTRLRRAALFGQPLVMDFSWEAIMNNRECRRAAYQIQLAYSLNRASPDPFDLWFVNLSSGSYMEHNLRTLMSHLYERNDHFVHKTPKHYLDLFPKQRLVYLTPLCDRPLTEVSPGDVYIIGAMQDRARCADVSYQRANIEGISFARLPLIEHLGWDAGGKGTWLFETVAILCKAKLGVPWTEAFSECSMIQK